MSGCPTRRGSRGAKGSRLSFNPPFSGDYNKKVVCDEGEMIFINHFLSIMLKFLF